jgi:hypothetical protein
LPEDMGGGVASLPRLNSPHGKQDANIATGNFNAKT